MNNVLKAEKFGDKVVEVRYDTEPENPRNWENIGTMVYRYRGMSENEAELDFEPFNSLQELIDHAKAELNALVVLPLRIYDHSGLSMSVGIAGGWDSSQVGIIYADKERVTNEFGADYTLERVEQILRSEVDIYDHYLTGEVFGYQIVEESTCSHCNHRDKEILDSSWGYYSVEDAFEAGKENI